MVSDDDSSAATRGRQPVRQRRWKPMAPGHKASKIIDLADRISSEGSAIAVHCLAHISLAESSDEKTGPAMLRKCANPTCTVPFRSLREGKLFLAEIFFSDDDEAPANRGRRKQPRREHFWLCQACACHFTLRFDSKQGMLTVPLVGHSEGHLRELLV
jgi:hypothetical protein